MAVDGEAEGALRHRPPGQRGDLLDLFRRGRFLDGALAHHVEAGCAVAHQAADVDHRPQPFDGVQIAAVGLPVPRQAGEDGVLRNVLDGLHHAGQKLAIRFAAGREGHAAVAEQRGGDAVPGDGRHVRIPADLGVQVGVQVDEAGGDRMAAGVDFFDALGGYVAHGNDGVAVDGDIRGERFGAGAVHDGAVADYEIMCHLLALSLTCGMATMLRVPRGRNAAAQRCEQRFWANCWTSASSRRPVG